MPVKTILDHEIAVRISDLPSGVLPNLVDALTIPNLEKLKAKKMDVYGWQKLPDNIELWRLEKGFLYMPRGFLHNFFEGMQIMGVDLDIEDHRNQEFAPPWDLRFDPYPWQERQISAIFDHQQGIIKSPAGSGKTVAVLGAVGRMGGQSIVLVNTKDVLWQWQERVADHLGPDYPCGQIGDGVFDVAEGGITIATAQTLHSRFDALEAEGFFDIFPFMCLDECHHATADTYNKIVSRFSSKYRIGVSATPDKTGDFAMATNVLGPIIHETKPSQVTNLLVPEVVKVVTKFGFGFRGQVSRWQRSNYPQMIAALIADEDRNQLIVDEIMANQGHHQLVVSKRLAHLDTIHAMLDEAGFRDPVVTIVGQDDNDHRREAKALAETEPCLILSTLADEALDIPRLDRLHLPFPQKNPGLVTQQVGRVERKHPDKKDAIIFDYADMNVGPLEKQWRVRRFEVYEVRGYKITTRKVAV